jgi:hypothetical protein
MRTLLGTGVIFLMFWWISIAGAHMHERPDLDHWLQTLYSKQRGPCCDSSEAETMADPDWRNASEMKPGECEPSANYANAEPPVYCVRLENPDVPGDYKWWQVPPAAVVELPNRAGPTLVWLIWYDRGQPSMKPYIRCFLPGTLS